VIPGGIARLRAALVSGEPWCTWADEGRDMRADLRLVLCGHEGEGEGRTGDRTGVGPLPALRGSGASARAAMPWATDTHRRTDRQAIRRPPPRVACGQLPLRAASQPANKGANFWRCTDGTSILGTQGDRLAIASGPAPICGTVTRTLVWYTPASNSVTPLLGGTVDGGTVERAIMFGTPW
jgi:hypothetical protein